MPGSRIPSSSRSAGARGSRRLPLLEAAARRFARSGYEAASMRDIAADVGIRAASIYYHFPSKAELLVAVHEEGLLRITSAVTSALAESRGPWQRLEAASVAHLEVLLGSADFYQAVMRELPRGPGSIRRKLVAMRDRYEAIFVELLEELPLSRGVDRHTLRLMLLGAMNWSHSWYHPGAESPAAIARKFVRYLRTQLDPEAGRSRAPARRRRPSPSE